ncbi:hypothetical protein [Alistipes sp.]|uniref:hypothetical protein n=1 Tax=Alistipes sp. TaxID=1872444 RepID=UPI003AF6598D
MNTSYYIENAEKVCELSMELNRRRISWLQHILLLASALLGLLAGLNPDLGYSLTIRVLYALTLIFLAFGIICGAIALYGFQVKIGKEMYEKFKAELIDALKENRELNSISDNLPNGYLWASRVCSCLFLCSLCSLVSYSMLTIFN